AIYERQIAAQAEESRETEKLIQTQTAQRAEAQENSAKIASQRASRLAAVSDRESELRRVRDSLGELQDRRAQGQLRESQFQMKVDNLLAHISRSYQIDLRGFAGDQPGFEKVLRAQLKKRDSADNSGSAGIDTREGVASAKEEPAPADLEQL